MTTIETERTENDLRESVHVATRLREDGIALSVRRRTTGPATGNFVKILELGEGRWLLALGEARGAHGPRLAEVVGCHVARNAKRFTDPGALVTSANELVHASERGEHLVSLVVLVVDARAGTVRLANAGHPLPLAAGRSEVVSLAERGPALGLLPGHRYRASGPLRVARGMVVLAATKSVEGCVDADGLEFGAERVGAALVAERSRGPRAVVRSLLERLDAFGCPTEAEDRTVLAFRFV